MCSKKARLVWRPCPSFLLSVRYDLAAATKLFVCFSWNSLWESYINGRRARMRLIRIDPLTDKIYLREETNFYSYVPNFLTEVDEIRYYIYVHEVTLSTSEFLEIRSNESHTSLKRVNVNFPPIFYTFHPIRLKCGKGEVQHMYYTRTIRSNRMHYLLSVYRDPVNSLST